MSDGTATPAANGGDSGFSAEAAALLGGVTNQDNEDAPEVETPEATKPEEAGAVSENVSDEGESDEPEEAETDEIASLRIQVKQLQALLQQQLQAPQQPQQTPQQAQVEQEVLFLDTDSDEAFETALSDPKEFNRLLNGVAKMVAQQTREAIFRDLPQLINMQVSTQQTVQQQVNAFYATNKDLYETGVSTPDEKAHRSRFISTVANQISSANPQWSLQEVLAKTDEQVRGILGIPRKAAPQQQQAKPTRDKRQPAFAPTPRGRTQPKADPSITDFQKQAKELLG